MKRFLVIFTILFGLFFAFFLQGMPAADAAKTKGKGGLNEKQITEIADSVNGLTKKIYMHELFSPQDSENLINIKLTLDSQMDVSPNPAFAPIYYRLANVYKLREMKTETIDCYKTILENFSDTAYAPKAREDLKAMGIIIKEDFAARDSEF